MHCARARVHSGFCPRDICATTCSSWPRSWQMGCSTPAELADPPRATPNTFRPEPAGPRQTAWSCYTQHGPQAPHAPHATHALPELLIAFGETRLSRRSLARIPATLGTKCSQIRPGIHGDRVRFLIRAWGRPCSRRSHPRADRTTYIAFSGVGASSAAVAFPCQAVCVPTRRPSSSTGAAQGRAACRTTHRARPNDNPC